MILDWVLANGDYILAAANVVFAFTLAPTIWHQRRVRASTLPLTTSVPTFLALAALLVLWVAHAWWLAAVTDAASTALWMIVAGQRIAYDQPKAKS